MKLNTVMMGHFGKQIINTILVINQKCFAFFLATAALGVHGLKKKVKCSLLLDLSRIYNFPNYPFLYLSYTKLWYCKMLITFDLKRVPLRFFTYKCFTLDDTHKFGFCWGWASPVTPGQVHPNGWTEDFNDFSLNLKNKYFPIVNRLFSFQIWIQHPQNYLMSNF